MNVSSRFFLRFCTSKFHPDDTMCEFLMFKLDFGARSCVCTKVYNLEYSFQGMDVDE